MIAQLSLHLTVYCNILYKRERAAYVRSYNVEINVCLQIHTEKTGFSGVNVDFFWPVQ